jgi:ligand-binding sensor domain-containing protein
MSIQHSFAATSILILLTIGPAAALDPNIRITQYGHTAWRLQDGVFDSAPNAITQTADGYVWIGTGSGLLKFDGVHFTSWAPQAGRTLSNSAIYSLLGSSDGTLWIGTGAAL